MATLAVALGVAPAELARSTYSELSTLADVLAERLAGAATADGDDR